MGVLDRLIVDDAAWSRMAATATAGSFRGAGTGDEHKYYHCQPCRNFGDKEKVPNAALVSQRFPTIPVNASNIVELNVCALLSSMGRKKMRGFVRQLLKDSSAASNASLAAAYSRCFA